MKVFTSIVIYLLLITTTARAADNLGFEPLLNSVDVGSLDEYAPFLLPDGFQQQLVTSVSTTDGLPTELSGSAKFDMLTLNETGVDAGRFLFRSHELYSSGNGGVSRTDLQTGETVTILQRSDLDNLDGILWTPWGTVLINEEVSYTSRPAPDFSAAVHGLVYEITNPLADRADLNVVARPALGSSAHEGMEIDQFGNLYVIDESRFGAIYKFTPSTPGDLSSGRLFALGDATPDDGIDVGVGTWIPLNDANGNPLEGVTDPRIDARAAAFDVGASVYNRPEDLSVGVLASGNQALYAALTSDSRVLSIELTDPPIVQDFVNRDTIDLATGVPVGEDFKFPDNLEIDADGRVYIVEDYSPGDVWTAVDADEDGVAEGIGRWASLSALGAEPTGLYFNPFDRNEAYINVQHPTNRPPADAPGDATYRILIPPPTLKGDFNHNGVLDTDDIDDLTVQSAASGHPGDYDLTDDGLVDADDVSFWIRELAGSWIGDVNLDLEFNTADLIELLAASTYELDVNSVWSTGDFNGDGRTTTLDLVDALADAGYEKGLRPDVTASVPEPTSSILVWMAAPLWRLVRRRHAV